MTAARADAVAPAPRRRRDEQAPAVERHLAVVGDEERIRRRVRWGSLSLIVLFLAVFGVVVFQALLVQAQGRIDAADRAIAAEEDRARDLRLALAAAESPERIAEAARTRLGMIVPAEQVYLQPEPTDEARAAFDPATAPAPSPTTTTPTTAATAKAPTTTAKAPTTTVKTPTTTAKTPTATAKAPATTVKTPTTTAKAPTTTVKRGTAR